MESLTKGCQLGDYEIEGKLGEGGMGVVYRARHLPLDRVVALKILSAQLIPNQVAVERFIREARATAILNHPNLVHVYEAGIAENIYFIAMEFVDGQTLAQLLARHPRLEEVQVLRFALQVAEALAFAHSSGIIHRDIKPENILISNEGQAKVADLGLAKWKSSQTDLSLTSDGGMVGSPYYIPPEQILDEQIDSRTDVYSLGMTLYHLLGGRPPFKGRTAPEVMAQHLTEAVAPLEELRKGLSALTYELVRSMVLKKREERIDMPVVVDTIREILYSKPKNTSIAGGNAARAPKSTATVTSSTPRVVKSKSLLPVSFAILVLANVVIVAWFLTYKWKPVQKETALPKAAKTASGQNTVPINAVSQATEALVLVKENINSPEPIHDVTPPAEIQETKRSEALAQILDPPAETQDTAASNNVAIVQPSETPVLINAGIKLTEPPTSTLVPVVITLDQIRREPASVEVLLMKPTLLRATKKKGGWARVPDQLAKYRTMIFYTDAMDGVADFKITAAGYAMVACDYGYPGNSSGGWMATRWLKEDFLSHGWLELSNEDLGGFLVNAEGKEHTVFVKKFAKGESGRIRCNKYHAPCFMITSNRL